MFNRMSVATVPAVPGRPLRGSFLLDAVQTVEVWTARAQQRRALRRLPDYVLRDMALSQADIDAEADKPFWKP